MAELSLAQARECFEDLVRKAAAGAERVVIIENDEALAAIVNPEELYELEEAVAVANFLLREAKGEVRWIPHAEARERLERLGLPPR